MRKRPATCRSGRKPCFRARDWLPATLVILFACLPAQADQYRSEVKELDNVPAEETAPTSTDQLLKITTDPYAKALLLRDLAAQAAGKNNYVQAAKYLEQAVAQGSLSGPAQEEMKRLLGQLYMAGGDPQKIIDGLGARSKAGSLSAEEMTALGSAYVKLKRYADAVPLLKNSVSAGKPANPAAMLALLSAYMATGQEKEALPLAEQLVRVAPQVRESWLNLGALLLKFGKKDRAQAVFELAQRQGFLQSANERLQLANLTAKIGAPFEAGSLLQRWISDGSVPRSAENWQFLAATWSAAREYALALTALREAYRLSPERDLLLQIGQLELDRANYAEAAQALEKAVAAGAKSGATYMSLGLAYYQQAKVDAALKAFQQADTYANTRAAAQGWLKFLETPAARDVAQLAASRQRPRKEAEAQLSNRLLGKAVAITEAPSAEELSRPDFGDEFTAIGAERNANADGRIPAWTGGLQKSNWPAGFKPGGRAQDPFPADKPLFTITAKNAAQYADKLSRAHKALFALYSDYKMPVFPTRRSVAYPQAIYDASQANIGKAKLLGSDALSGARLGVPFPRPQNGVEVMWNHRTRYRGDTAQIQTTQAVVEPGGGIRNRFKNTFRVYFRYGNIKEPVDIAKKNIIVNGITFISESGRSPDFVVLFHETANSITDPRRLWVLLAKLKKMMRLPPIGYDQPYPAAEALMFIDMIDMYNGAFDRYVWKLTGKREVYVPYNAFRLNDGRYKYDQLLTGRHLNQDPARYELHRVWVIEAVERGGKKHVFGKRTFYVDEDSWNILLVENEDHAGNIWRFQEGHLLPNYEIQAATCAPVVTYDLKDGRYFINALTNEDPPAQFGVPMQEKEFFPDTVKMKYGN